MFSTVFWFHYHSSLCILLQMHPWFPSVWRRHLNANLSRLSFYCEVFILMHNIQHWDARYERVLFLVMLMKLWNIWYSVVSVTNVCVSCYHIRLQVSQCERWSAYFRWCFRDLMWHMWNQRKKLEYLCQRRRNIMSKNKSILILCCRIVFNSDN